MSRKVVQELKKLSNARSALGAQRFFKTGIGQYGEGDIFLGISVPKQREMAKKFQDLSLREVKELLESPIHEHRFVALEILVFQFEKAGEKEQETIVKFYLKYKKHINNWDLVDTSAPYILGRWLKHNDRTVLYRLAKSKSLWDRRIAIVSTYTLIKSGEFEDTLKLSQELLADKEDLIHKAVGWMLREVGKQSEKTLARFLDQHATKMPRTTLRYAIERLEEKKRRFYLTKKAK